MSGGADRLDELRGLLESLCEESITPDRMGRLGELILSDPEAEAFYIQYMHVQAGLLRKCGGGSIRPAAGVAGRGGAAGGAARRQPTGATLGWSPWWRWLAALFVVGLIGLLLPRGRREAPVAVAPPSTAAPPAALPPTAAKADDLAVVVQASGVAWEPGASRRPAVGDVLPASRLSLRAGHVTLAFYNGVLLTLEGPTDLEIISVDRVFCHRGKIRARVPEGAEGFVASSAGSNVIDLGTDFGMNVEADGKAKVMVFEGEVEAYVLAGSAQRNLVVQERDALEIDPSAVRFKAAEPSPESFARFPEATFPPLELAPSYPAAVRASQPWGYWRFESMDGGQVPNEVAGRPPLRATGPLRLADAGAGNRCVAFAGGGEASYLLMDGLWAPPRDPGYAVEAWFAPERIGQAAVASLLVPQASNDFGHVFYLELTTTSRKPNPLWRASIRFLHRWPPATAGGDNLLSNHYLPYRWRHVVAQTRGDRMELYVDGVPLDPLSISSDHATMACQLLLGRLKPLPASAPIGQTRPFAGRIDEVAVYEHPLSAEDVRRHYELGARRGAPADP